MDHIGFKVENLEVFIQDLEILIKGNRATDGLYGCNEP